MIVRIVHAYVAEESLQEFREATKKNHAASVQEPGVLRFDVLEDVDRPGHFVLYEVYRSEAAAESHKRTPHYAEWKTAVAPMMERDRESAAFQVVAPKDVKMWKP